MLEQFRRVLGKRVSQSNHKFGKFLGLCRVQGGQTNNTRSVITKTYSTTTKGRDLGWLEKHLAVFYKMKLDNRSHFARESAYDRPEGMSRLPRFSCLKSNVALSPAQQEEQNAQLNPGGAWLVGWG